MDNDFNPYNGGEQLVAQRSLSGTGVDGVINPVVPISVNTTTGLHYIYARVTANGHPRYLYAPELIEILPEPVLPPGIVSQPAPQTVKPGTHVTFSVMATGTPPLFFQWHKEGAPLSGQTNNTLQLTGASATDSGDYTVVVANSSGAVTSAVARLTLIFPPQVVLNGGSLTNLQGSSLVLTANVQGTAPLTYQWFFRNRRLVGATGEQLALTNITTKATGTYALEVRNSAGVVRSLPITIRVVLPPVIKTQPRSLTVRSGRRAVFRVGATGTKPFSYQWLKESVPISNATNRTLVLPAVQASNAGLYSVRVSNVGTNSESTGATLTVLE